MNPEIILDAIGMIDEELLADVDRIRQIPKRSPIPFVRIGGIAAAVVLVLVGSAAALRFGGMFTYKSADLATENEAADIMYGATDDDMREDVFLNGSGSTAEESDGSAPTIGNTIFFVTSWEGGRLLAEPTTVASSSFSEQYPQVNIIGDDITEADYPVGTYIMVYYSEIDATTDPATIHAVSIETVHNVFEP